MGDDFYVGYLPQAPASIARLARRVAVGLVLGALLVGATLVLAQGPFSSAVFEYGRATTLTGRLELSPVPSLVVSRPGTGAGTSRVLLTVFGKRGARADVEAWAGHQVRLEGALIHHDGQVMLELVPGSIDDLGPVDPHPGSTPQALGTRTLQGEVVDSKCFLGVMKPGRAKPHRACATRCISGGVPPVLLVRDEQGHATCYLLTGPGGEALGARILDRIAEPIEISGEVVRHDDVLVLATDPDTWRRLP